MSKFGYLRLLTSDLVVWLLIGISCGLTVFSIASKGLSPSGYEQCWGYCSLDISYSTYIEPILDDLSSRLKDLSLFLIAITPLLGIYVAIFEHEHGYSLFSLMVRCSRTGYHFVRLLGTLAMYCTALVLAMVLGFLLIDRYLLFVPMIVFCISIAIVSIAILYYVIAVVVSIIARSSFRALAISLAMLFLLYSLGIPWKLFLVPREEVSIDFVLTMFSTRAIAILSICISILVILAKRLSLR